MFDESQTQGEIDKTVAGGFAEESMEALLLDLVVEDFARGMMAADSRRPMHISRTGREYKPGIGPHAESRAVSLTLDEMRKSRPDRYSELGQDLAYPRSKQKCDIWLGAPLQWAIEVKMARLFGDNGKPDDTSLKDILSPYESHRSALTDCVKLARSEFLCKKAVLIYGFEYPQFPLGPCINAFEVLAKEQVSFGRVAKAVLADLVHPVHAQGVVLGWEILEKRTERLK